MKLLSLKGYFMITGIFFHIAILISVFYGTYTLAAQGHNLNTLLTKAVQTLEHDYPSLDPITGVLKSASTKLSSNSQFYSEFSPKTWPTVGPKSQSYLDIVPQDLLEKPLYIRDSQQLILAIKNAKPNSAIIVKNGDYKLSGKLFRISTETAGKSSPIYLVSESVGQVNIYMDTSEGIYLNGPNWVIAGLNFIGVCSNPARCDHAIHVVGEANNSTIIHNSFVDFNAAIKVNALKPKYPDNGVVAFNHFYSTKSREVNNSVTPINIDHANNWHVKNNIIRDFEKTGGNRVSYGAFIKGGANKGTFENNLVICSTNKLDKSVATVGLSLGGGGMSKNTRRDSSEYESNEVTVKNNIVMHCTDVALYVNKGQNSIVHNNIFYNTTGLDVRFPESNAIIFNNIMNGEIRERDNGTSEQFTNIVRNAGFWSDINPLKEIYSAPDNGIFTLINDNHFDTAALEYEQSNEVVSYDFCNNELIGKVKTYGAFIDSNECFIRD